MKPCTLCGSCRPKRTCALCGNPAEGEYAIHRDGMGVGPQVRLCNACGSQPTPTCEDIWEALHGKRLPKSAILSMKSHETKRRK